MPIIVHIQGKKYPRGGKYVVKKGKIMSTQLLSDPWLGYAVHNFVPNFVKPGKWMTLQSNLWVPFVICYQIVISFSVCSKEKIKAKEGKNDK